MPCFAGHPACHYCYPLGSVCKYVYADVVHYSPVAGLAHHRHHLVLPAVWCKRALVGRADGNIDGGHDAVIAGCCSAPPQHSAVHHHVHVAGGGEDYSMDNVVVPCSCASSIVGDVVSHLGCTGFFPFGKPALHRHSHHPSTHLWVGMLDA